MKNFILSKEDYAEPRCPFCEDFYTLGEHIESIDLGRVLGKFDEYLARNDYNGAEKHLLYWYNEAKEGNDVKGQLAVANELMGVYRKTDKKKQALNFAEIALELVKILNIETRTDAGVTYTNCATVYKTFGYTDKAIELFGKTEKIYNENSIADDLRKGTLYNNTALAYADLKNYKKAFECYEKAIEIMSKNENGELECAITYLNMADCIESEKGYEQSEKEIADLIEKSYVLLMTPHIPRNGYYAFVCEKCASSFGYFGYFMYENELKKIAGSIYERN